jgi:membrane protease YdiL (CAAX protease family)
MIEGTFSHSIIRENPIPTLCFFAFAMSFLSLWARKTAWLWGSFLLIAYVLAFQAHIADGLSLLPVLILFLCHYFMKDNLSKRPRFIFWGIATLISFALAFHFFPGFHNWQLASNLKLSPEAYPYSLWLNFDKPFIGLFVLVFSLPLITSASQWTQILKVSIPFSVLGILIMMGISLYFGLVKWDPKVPVISVLWLIDNLIFVCIPEEAFFRGFLQKEFFYWLGGSQLAALGSILITAIFFSLLHLLWVANLPLICLVFVASVIYGTIYQWTQAIESSIICHFCLNVTHFFLFTYPALQN